MSIILTIVLGVAGSLIATSVWEDLEIQYRKPFIAAFLIVLAIVLNYKRLLTFMRNLLQKTPATSVSDNDTSDAEIEDVHITEEIRDSWNEIIAAINDGTAQQRYAVGAYKPLDLGQFGTVNMQLAGFNLDERADGQGKAATTWIAKEILSETHRWNPEWDYDKEGTGTIGGWAKCELRKWMNERVRPAIPVNVRDRLVPVKKTQESYDSVWNYIEQTTEDSIWIPSYDEVFGDQLLYYGLFWNQSDRRVKTRDGSAAWWWVRSAGGSYYAGGVSYDGSSNSYGVASTSGGVVLGFCL